MNKIEQLGHWLAGFPYENLTKRLSESPREPGLMLEERNQRGAGGTCFSLVNLAVKQARDMKLDPKIYLGDRPGGEDRHCVIGFPQNEVFLDPGYLCFDPLPLNPGTDFRLFRPHNVLHLEPVSENKIKVLTERKGQKTWRYTLKTRPTSRDRFERAWKQSFEWSGVMDSLVMTRLRENDMICYLNGRLESITREERTRLEPSPDQPAHVYLSDLFGVEPGLIERWNPTINSVSKQS